MMKFIMEFSAVAIESILVVYFLSSYFNLKSKQYAKLKYILFFIVLFPIDLTSIIFNTNEIILISSLTIAAFIFLFLLYNGNTFEKIVLSIVSYTLFAFINLPVLFLLSYILDTDTNNIINDEGALRFFVLFTTKLLYLFITYIIVSIRNNRDIILTKSEWIYLIIISIMILSINIIIFITDMPNVNKIFEEIMLWVLEISIVAMVVKMSMNNKKNIHIQEIANDIKLKEVELLNLTSRYNELNEFKHNTKNQLQNIKAFIIEKKEEECVEYIDSLTNEIVNLKKYIITESPLINAVLNTKISLAEKNNIKVRTLITLEFDDENTNFYISNILSNLLDNAIEACLKNKKDSEIRINGYVDGKNKVIKISNTIEESVLSYNSELNTTKKDKNCHGIGLKSVKNNIKKMNASINFFEDRGMFIAIIIYS